MRLSEILTNIICEGLSSKPKDQLTEKEKLFLEIVAQRQNRMEDNPTTNIFTLYQGIVSIAQADYERQQLKENGVRLQ